MPERRSTTPRDRSSSAATSEPGGPFGPIIFDPRVESDRIALDRLRATGRVTRSTDLVPKQLAELTVARGDRMVVRENAGACPTRWVFYPWSGQLVRTLSEPYWTALRTDRNRYKLTTAEQDCLAGASVAVAGLSVGASVLHVLALEGTGGRLKVADPDTLDGSNCNRLRAAIWDLDQHKAVLAARMVWEVDPFRRVEVIPEGVSVASVASFLDDVDIVVEECDSFAMKVLIRAEARRRRIPVVMATAEGGMLDVERFDLEPSRPLFHGLAPGLETANLSTLGADDRVRFALQVIGVENVSDRSAASMIEIDQTLASWPQLAAEVVAGGAHAAVAVRRILLGRECPSGRYRLDVDRELGSGPVRSTDTRPVSSRVALATSRRAVSVKAGEFIEEIVAAATSAPSAGNAQPWRFGWDGRHLRIWLDRERARSAIDPECAAGWIAVGAACENIAIASAHGGRPAMFTWFPDRSDADLAAVVTFIRAADPPDHDSGRLFSLIGERRTDRTAGCAGTLSGTQRRELRAAAARHDASLHLIEDHPRMARFATVLGESDRIRMLTQTMHCELARELRWSSHDAHASADGIDVATLGLPPGGEELLRLLMRPTVSAFLAEHDLGSRLSDMQRRALMSTAALGLLTVDARTPAARVRGGRALQRVWLEATAHRLAVHPVTPLSLFGLLDSDGADLSNPHREGLAAIARGIDELFAVGNEAPILIIRLHHGSAIAPARAFRRGLDDVLETTLEAA